LNPGDSTVHLPGDPIPLLRAERRGGGTLAGLFLLLLAAAGYAGYLRYGGGEAQQRPQYRTGAVTRGDLTVTVAATGVIEPVNQVEVGTEVSGTVETVSADFNDRVAAGQELARLDTDRLEAQVRLARAALESSRAALLEAQATVAESLRNRERLRRMYEVSGGKVPSRQELDAIEATADRARAGEATARSRITEAEARLSMDETNLTKAVIRSPIDGIVLKRQVEPGQTVAASLQTPVLFTLAENLGQMELRVQVDEADVGRIADGQEASFTVDAYADRRYPARIKQVRYAPLTVEGVVTYETLLVVDNSDLSLRPGMTAQAEIVVGRRPQALLVPNAALRFLPPPAEPVSAGRRGLLDSLFMRPPPDRRRGNDSAAGPRVWVVRGDALVAVSLTPGATDGTVTEVVAGDLEVGAALAIDIAASE